MKQAMKNLKQTRSRLFKPCLKTTKTDYSKKKSWLSKKSDQKICDCQKNLKLYLFFLSAEKKTSRVFKINVTILKQGMKKKRFFITCHKSVFKNTACFRRDTKRHAEFCLFKIFLIKPIFVWLRFFIACFKILNKQNTAFKLYLFFLSAYRSFYLKKTSRVCCLLFVVCCLLFKNNKQQTTNNKDRFMTGYEKSFIFFCFKILNKQNTALLKKS